MSEEAYWGSLQATLGTDELGKQEGAAHGPQPQRNLPSPPGCSGRHEPLLPQPSDAHREE